MRVRCNRPEDLAAIEKAPVAPGGLGGAVVWRDQLIKSHLIYPHHCTVGGLDPPVCPGKSGAGTGPPPHPPLLPEPYPLTCQKMQRRPPLLQVVVLVGPSRSCARGAQKER